MGKAPKKGGQRPEIPQAPSFLFSSLLPLSCVELSLGEPGETRRTQSTRSPGRQTAGMKRATEGEQEESITGADRLHEAMENSSVTNKNKAANMHSRGCPWCTNRAEHPVKGTESL